MPPILHTNGRLPVPIRVWLFGLAALYLLSSLPLGCMSRYQLDMYLTAEQPRKRVKLEVTEFAPKTILRAPESEDKLASGPGNCLVFALSTRGARQVTPIGNVLGYDEYLRYQIFVQLPASLRADTIALMGNSFVSLLGKYEQPSSATIYKPVSGSMVIDSVLAKRFFATFNGEFRNASGATLRIDGRFKVKTAE